jgi:hypothetical protein
MPRKRTVKKDESVDPSKPTIEDKLANRNESKIVRLPLTDELINQVMNNTNDEKQINEPIAYEPSNVFTHEAELLKHEVDDKRSVCYWCCHPITNFSCGMPISYYSDTDNFKTYGTFCSFQCANALNFNMNSKSDKAWNINQMINDMARRYGITDQIKPAPSRFHTELFGGPLTIEEFRMAHQNIDRAIVENIPPMSSVVVGMERLNISYIPKK